MKFLSHMIELRDLKISAEEIKAAENVHDRLVTAQAMCLSVFGADVSQLVVVTLMAALSDEARFLKAREGEVDAGAS